MAGTEQEHAEILAQINREMQEFGQVLPGTRASMDALSVGGKAATAAFDGVGKAAGSVAKAYYDAAAAMYNGEKGMKAYNKSIDSGADAVVALTGAAAAAAVAIGAMTMGVGLIVAGVAVAAKAVADYTKAANEQSDALFDSYQKLSRVGAAGADSLQGIYNDMQKLGLGVKDLDKFVALVAGSSKELAMMSGTVYKGRKEFADITKGMDKFKLSLLNAGMTQDEINEGTMDYLRLQSRAGLTQKKSVDELAISTAAYLKEQDKLTQLIGLSRKEQSDQRERLRNNEIFGSQVAAMRLSGDKKQADAADEMEKSVMMMATYNQTAADGMRDMASGILDSEAAQKLMRSSNGEGLRAMQDLKAGIINANEAFDRVAKANVRTFKEQGKVLGGLGVYNKVYTDVAGDARLAAAMENGTMVKRMKDVEENYKKQGAEDGKALSAEQQRQAELVQIQQDSMHNMQDFVRYGVTPATEATAWFAKTVENVTSLLPGAGAAREEAKFDQNRRAAEEQNAKIVAAMEKQKTSTNAAELETAKLAEKTAREKRALLDKEREELLKVSKHFEDKQQPKSAQETAGQAAKEAKDNRVKAEDNLKAATVEREKLQKEKGLAHADTKKARQAERMAREEAEIARVQERTAQSQNYAQGGVSGIRRPASAALTGDATAALRAQADIDGLKREIARAEKGTGVNATAKADQLQILNAELKKAQQQLAAASGTGQAPVGGRGASAAASSAPAAAPAAASSAPAAAPKAAAPKAAAPSAPSGGAPAVPAGGPAPDYSQEGKNTGGSDQELKKSSEDDVVQGSPRKSTDAVILHHTGGRSLSGAVSTLKSRGLAYHYMIDRDGKIVPFMADNAVAYHAGSTDKKPTVGNWNTLGIAAVANDNKDVTKEQMIAAIKLNQDLSGKFGYGSQNVFGHGQVTSRKGADEGTALVDAIKNGVKDTNPQAQHGGIFSGPMSGYPVTMHGNEAVIPLKNGKVPVHIDSTNSQRLAGGHSELQGYNAGPMTTDLAMLEKVAGKLGAYDKSTQMITDPKLWKDILQSGMMMNYDMGGAQVGTKDLSSRIGAETVADALAGRLKELIDTKKEDNSEAIAQTRTEFADMMKTFYEDFFAKMQAQMAQENPLDSEILATLREISKSNANVADTSEKMLRVAQN